MTASNLPNGESEQPAKRFAWDELRDALSGKSGEASRRRVAEALEDLNSPHSQMMAAMKNRVTKLLKPILKVEFSDENSAESEI